MSVELLQGIEKISNNYYIIKYNNQYIYATGDTKLAAWNSVVDKLQLSFTEQEEKDLATVIATYEHLNDMAQYDWRLLRYWSQEKLGIPTSEQWAQFQVLLQELEQKRMDHTTNVNTIQNPE